MKSFSWTLALRYLNPLRAFVSVITLLALLGVAFGVMVLVVVLSVHAGFERNLKSMLLGFAPHVQVMSAYQGLGITNWEVMERDLAEMPEIEEAYALVEGSALLDAHGTGKPIVYRAINTERGDQLAALEEMLQEGAVDFLEKPLSLDELEAQEASGEPREEVDGGAVISALTAQESGLQVGDTLQLLASSNLNSLMEVYRAKGKPRAVEMYQDRFASVESGLKTIFEKDGDSERAPTSQVTQIYELMRELVPEDDEHVGAPMRQVERRLIGELLDLLDEVDGQGDGMDFYAAGTQRELLGKLEELKTFDLKQADLEAFEMIEQFVLPLNLRVTGIYSDAQRAQGPSVFLSLERGQQLSGLADSGVVASIGLRTSDPYRAEEVVETVQKQLGEDWVAWSWMRRYSGQFQLIRTEKIMMSFALSFITLISAFSITAVMYTMTVQKRQEIGVMKALGASPSQIINVFLYQGIIVGVGGALLGLGLGLLAIQYRHLIVEGIRAFGVDPFPPEFHGMTELPARVIPEYLVVIGVVAVILCLIAALIPAMLAAFRDPAKSLRNL